MLNELSQLLGRWASVTLSDATRVVGTVDVQDEAVTVGGLPVPVERVERVTHTTNPRRLPVAPGTHVEGLTLTDGRELTGAVLDGSGRWHGLDAEGYMVSVEAGEVTDWRG